MKLWSIALGVAIVSLACANRQGSSPSVPEPAIEKAANTKIEDAGSDAATPVEPSEPSDGSFPAAVGTATH